MSRKISMLVVVKPSLEIEGVISDIMLACNAHCNTHGWELLRSMNIGGISLFLAFNHAIRWPCWCAKQVSKMLLAFCIIREPNSQKTFLLLFSTPTCLP